MQHPGGPFSIPAINGFVPEKLKPWIIVLFVVIFQFAGGGIYLATLSQVVGDNALMQEDITMAGYATLIGTALIFAVMLRLKMRFLSKHIFLVCTSVLIACNLLCLYTTNVFALVALCFIAGLFRMWATFECNSTIQLWITPKRDLSIFFCFVNLLVQGSILLSGSTQIYLSYISNWQYVYWFVIGALFFVLALTLLLFNSKRFMRPFPLFGIDWFGMFMWGLTLLCFNFIAIYGEHYDWFASTQIRTASLFTAILLALNLYRASFIRHPFIPLQVFKHPMVYLPFAVYLLVDFLIAPAHLIEEIYFSEILQYDTAHMISMNWFGFAGVAVAAVFTYFYFARGKASHKSTFMIGFSAILVYLLSMYFLLDYSTSQGVLGLALFCRNFGYVVIAIVLLTALVKIPFPIFFQSLTVQAFVSAACGSAVTGAVLHHLFSHSFTENFQVLSASMDRVNSAALQAFPQQLGALVSEQALMVTFKEIYGILVMLALAAWLFLFFFRSGIFRRRA